MKPACHDRRSRGLPGLLATLALLVSFAAGCGKGDATEDATGDVPGDATSDVPEDLPDATDPGTDAFPLSPNLPPLPLRVQGRYVVDRDGLRVRLVGVNWNGGHQESFVPTGLDHQTPAAIAARLREMGFNSVRLTYSDRMVRDNPVPPDAALAANPSLQGRPALETFDAVVEALAAEGLLVLLNNHMSDAAWCCSLEDGNALWYNPSFPESDWIANWLALARRYRHVAAVAGADLRNEPRFPAQWGSAGGDEIDWPAAAERCGTALLAENPDLLILVEGTNFATDLSDAGGRPIALPADRLVYSAHDYPWSTPGLASTYDDYAMMVDGAWGYLMDGPGAAPVWLGEFGTGHDAMDANWWQWIGRYVSERQLDWALWLIFADPGSTWGLLDPATLQPTNAAFWESLQGTFMGPAGTAK